MRALIAALVLVVMPGTLASADPAAKPYAPITTVGLKPLPFDACMTACAGPAEPERAKLGASSAAPLYRVSATQAAATRANLVKATVAHFASTFGLDLLKLALTHEQGFVIKTNP